MFFVVRGLISQLHTYAPTEVFLGLCSLSSKKSNNAPTVGAQLLRFAAFGGSESSFLVLCVHVCVLLCKKTFFEGFSTVLFLKGEQASIMNIIAYN